jgi:hypothetical protein
MDELDQLEQSIGSMPEGGMQMAPQMAPQTTSNQPSVENIMQELGTLSEEEKAYAVQSLQQLIQIVEQMEASGASVEEIEQFLAEVGLTLEDLEMLESVLLGDEMPQQNVGMMM